MDLDDEIFLAPLLQKELDKARQELVEAQKDFYELHGKLKEAYVKLDKKSDEIARRAKESEALHQEVGQLLKENTLIAANFDRLRAAFEERFIHKPEKKGRIDSALSLMYLGDFIRYFMANVSKNEYAGHMHDARVEDIFLDWKSLKKPRPGDPPLVILFDPSKFLPPGIDSSRDPLDFLEEEEIAGEGWDLIERQRAEEEYIEWGGPFAEDGYAPDSWHFDDFKEWYD